MPLCLIWHHRIRGIIIMHEQCHQIQNDRGNGLHLRDIGVNHYANKKCITPISLGLLCLAQQQHLRDPSAIH